MFWLFYEKRRVGEALQSDAIIADANCTKACIQLSVVLLLASLGYEFFGISSIDEIGSLFIAWITFYEGKESFERAIDKIECCRKHEIMSWIGCPFQKLKPIQNHNKLLKIP